MIQNNCHNIERKEFREFFFINSITDFILLSLYGMHYPLHARASALGKIPYLVTDVKFVLLFCTLLKLVKTDNFISHFYRFLDFILCRDCISTGAVVAQTRRSLGHHLLHPQILSFLVCTIETCGKKFNLFIQV